MHHTISKSVMEFVNQNNQINVDEEYTLLSTGCRFTDETAHTHPNFAGLSLSIPHWEKIRLLSRINNLISKWIPHFSNLGDIKFVQTPREDDGIIRLNKSEHCILFKFFFDAIAHSSSYQDSVKSLYYLYEVTEKPNEGGIFAMCKNPPNDIITNGKASFKCGYLLYVPGIVMGLTVDIINEFVSFPNAEFVTDANGSFELDNNDMVDFLENIRNGLIIEENTCPHITLGTSKDFKPVITGQILNSIYQFLNVIKDKTGEEYKVYSADENDNVSPVLPSYLYDVLRIQKSEPAVDPENLSKLVFATANKIYGKNLQNLNFTYNNPNDKSKEQIDFSNTKVIISKDISLIYFKDFPVTDEFTIDVYLMPVGGDIRSGHIKIFQ